MRFLLDENLPATAAHALRRLGHDVALVGETDLRGHPDEQLIKFCNEDDRVLVTLDLGMSQQTARLVTGLVLLRIPRRITSDMVVALLSGIFSGSAEPNLRGNITVISPGRMRSRPLEPA